MPALYRASFGYLIKHPWQLGLALLGICIGVAVMVAVDLANSSSARAFRLSMDTLNGSATHQIVGGPAGIEEAVYVRLRTEAGLRALAPVVDGDIEVGSVSLTVLGIDVFAEQGFRRYSTPGGGQGGDGVGLTRDVLTVPGAVLMSAGTAAALGLGPGDAFDLVASGRGHRGRLVGIFGEDDGRLDNIVVTDIANAQVWFDSVGYLTRIDVRPEADGVPAARLADSLPPGLELLEADSRTQATAEMTSAFMTNLTAMSLLAMLVGIFLIYNSVGFAVVQRRGLIGVLRALGLTRRQTFWLIMGEGMALGVVGAILGVLAGLWLGELLLTLVSRSINDLYFRVTVTDVSPSPFSLAKGAVAGFAATLIAAAIPALEASGFEPSLSLRRSVLEQRTGKAVPRLLLAGALIMALAAALLLASGRDLVAGLVALFMLILGFALCIPFVVRAAAGPLAALALRVGGSPARMAVDGIRASLSRTGVAIVALAVAVSATVGVTVMVDSFRLAVSDWLGNTLRSDIYLGVAAGSLDSTLIDDLVAVPGIAEVSTSRRAWLESGSGRTRVIALSMAGGSYAGTRLIDASPDEVWPAFDDDGALVISETYAYRNRVGAGDEVSLRTNDGLREFRIAGTYRSYDANQGAIVMSRNTYDRYWSDDGVDSLGIYLAEDADIDAVMSELQRVSDGRQSIRMSSNRDLKEISLAIFDRTFVITNVLYWLAVGVAVIGILGAMLALQLERARDLAILRALGMTPGQLGGMVTLQTTVIGCMAGLAAVPLGLVMAWVLIDVINRRSFGWKMDMSVAAGVPLTAVALATGAALFAGVYPAVRAALSSPAAAMREE